MSKKNEFHIVPYQGNWAAKPAGNNTPLQVFHRKADAVGFGRDIARKKEGELVIHKKDGTFQERYSYGNDPFPPRG